MDQLLGFVAQGENKKVSKLKKLLYWLKQSPKAWIGWFCWVVKGFGLQQNHFVFFRLHLEKRILLVVYVDDIVITGDDDEKGIKDLKSYIHKKSHTNNHGQLQYLGIEVARSKKGVSLSSRKCTRYSIRDWDVVMSSMRRWTQI